MDYPRFDLVIYPSAILERQTAPVTKFDSELKDFVDYMFEVMYKHDGIGLAAPQVGISRSIFVLDISGTPKAFINPNFSVKSDSRLSTLKEGCLSFPGVFVDVDRNLKIDAEYMDVEGKKIEESFYDIHAIAYQHEFDHLNGITFLTYVGELKRKIIRERMINARR